MQKNLYRKSSSSLGQYKREHAAAMKLKPSKPFIECVNSLILKKF
jgi:hypothetical protein